MAELKESDWQKMAIPLQMRFSDIVRDFMKSYESKLKETEEIMQGVRLEHSSLVSKIKGIDEWKVWKIVAIDGSNSSVSEKNGISVGCISATAIEVDLKAGKTTGEWYDADVIVDDGSINKYNLEFDEYVDLKRMEMERKMLKNVCKREVDLVIIDGPFFPRTKFIDASKKSEDIKEVLDNIISYTNECKESPVIAVVKRSRSVYFYSKSLLEGKKFPRLTDKMFTTFLLNPGDYCHASTISEARKITWRASSLPKATRSEDVAVDWINKRFHPLGSTFVQSFDADMYFIKTTGDDSFKVEVPKLLKGKKDSILSFLSSWSNPDTGLPYALDLVDHLSGVPRGFSGEFVEELESGLYSNVKDPRKVKFISRFFAALNPQSVYK